MVKIIFLLAFAIILADARKHHLEIRVSNTGMSAMDMKFHIFDKIFPPAG